MYGTNDMLQVRINDASKVEYVRNGVVVYNSTVTPSFPMLVDASFYTEGGGINSFKYITTSGFDAVPSSATNGATVTMSTGMSSSLSQSSTTVTKSSSGGNSWDNAGAMSSKTIPSEGYGIEFKAGQTTANVSVGLTSLAAANSFSYTTMTCALSPKADSKLHVYESGTDRGTTSPSSHECICTHACMHIHACATHAHAPVHARQHTYPPSCPHTH